MKASPKNPAIDKCITNIFGIDRVKCIQENKCPCCKADINVNEFRDTLSVKEWTISGMCQACQDSVFDAPEPYDDNYDEDDNEPAF